MGDTASSPQPSPPEEEREKTRRWAAYAFNNAFNVDRCLRGITFTSVTHDVSTKGKSYERNDLQQIHCFGGNPVRHRRIRHSRRSGCRGEPNRWVRCIDFDRLAGMQEVLTNERRKP